MNKIKYNFGNSLLSVLVGWLFVPLLSLIVICICWLFDDSRDLDFTRLMGSLLGWGVVYSILSLSFCLLSLFVVPLIVSAFNYFFKHRNLFPLWTALCGLLCFEVLSLLVGVLIFKVNWDFLLDDGFRIYHLLAFLIGFICGATYLFLDKKFFSKEESKS